MGDARYITRALGGRWCGGYGSARCPAHEDRSPSLSLRDGERGILVTCHAGCVREDIINALRALGLWEGRPAAELPRPQPKPPAESSAGPDEATRIGWALRLWAEARDPRGTVVEQYLGGRRLELPEDADRVLRFHPHLWHRESETAWPAMVALMTDLGTDKPTGIHRTFLAPDGAGKAPVAPPKKMLATARGAAIKLDPDDAVTTGLVIGEGVESGLAARMLGYRPTWALGSAGAICRLPVLGGVEALTILGEADDSGANARAAEACARRWVGAGLEVSVLEPIGGGDANDVLQEMQR